LEGNIASVNEDMSGEQQGAQDKEKVLEKGKEH